MVLLKDVKPCWLPKASHKKYEIDYQELLSLVMKLNTVRCLIALAAHRDWKLYQLDVNNAFLRDTLKDEVYMKVPEGKSHLPSQVCKRNMTLYGLKKASREWNDKLVAELLQQGFTQSKLDYSLFIHKQCSNITIVDVYVDDILLTSNNLSTIETLKQHLHSTFGIKDLCLMHCFLGIKNFYLCLGIVFSRTKYTKDILQLANIDLSS